MKLKYVYDYPRPSVTATIAILVVENPNDMFPGVIGALIGTRGRKDGAYAGFLCIPGGFLDAKVDRKDIIELSEESIFFTYDEEDEEHKELLKSGETVEDAAIREVFEETGLVISKDQLKLYHVHSDPNTDPRAHVVNICYYVLVDRETANMAKAGDDLAKLDIMTFENSYSLPVMAFNHAELLSKALEKFED
jgi:ADP-ribose pyrophosphatase YjhB (NUDIX family)